MKKKKIGIMLLTTEKDGGIHHYAHAVTELLLASRFEQFDFVLFKRKEDTRSEGYDCESRCLEVKMRVMKKLQCYVWMLTGIKSETLVVLQDKELFFDIDGLFCPNILYYPVVFLNIPYAMTVHDVQEQIFPSFFSTKEKIKRRLVNRSIVKTAKRIICESSIVSKDLVHFLQAQSNKIFVIPAPIRESIKRKTTREMKTHIEGFDFLNNKYLFFPAYFWKHKNHIRLIKAFKNIDLEFHLVFSGHSNEGLPTIKDQVETEMLQKRVSFLSYVSDEDLSLLYQHAQMLVFPSLHESISLPIEEAKHHGIKVCCSKFLGELHDIPDGYCFDPMNIQDMTNKINYTLSTSVQQKSKMIFDSSAFYLSFEKLFEELCSNKVE